MTEGPGKWEEDQAGVRGWVGPVSDDNSKDWVEGRGRKTCLEE